MERRKNSFRAFPAFSLTRIIPETMFLILVFATPAPGDWNITGEGSLYYTDDAALFSATRRLTRDQDPTQPAIDEELAEQGSDIVFEPDLQITKSFDLQGRKTTLSIRGQGFLFTDNSRFNHGSLGVEGLHHYSPATTIGFRYFFAPDLLLGENVEKRSGMELRADERFTTNFLAVGIKRHVSEEVVLILYGRYGMRSYNQEFTQRDTHFWTIGTHAEWEVNKDMAMAAGYHYERGLADGRNEPALKDDVSYYNHFVTMEFKMNLMESLALELGMHYEFNGWTTGIVGDIRNGQHENIIQGDLQLRHRFTRSTDLLIGVQEAHRKESFEEDGLENFNGWVGVQMVF